MTLEELKKIIKSDKEAKTNKYYARRYYNYKPNTNFPSMNRTYEKEIMTTDKKVVTVTKTKETFLYTNYAKLIVNQKIDYIMAKKPTINNNFTNYTITEIADMLEDIGLTASLDIKSWLFFYVDNNILQWVLLPDWQIIDIKDKWGKETETIIRYYETKEKESDQESIINVEVWTLGGVELFKYKESQNVFLYSEMISHYKETKYYNNELESEESKNLPFIPFICLENNKNMENDIEGIKDLLDFYNIIKSGFIDNVFKFQDALMKLKGFTGNDKFYEETQKKMIKFKMLALSDPEADAEYMKIDIPFEARELILSTLKENIFKIGQGLDPDKIGDGNITNIVIKNRYQALNMKSEKCIKQLKLFYSKFIDCLNMFYRTNYNKDIEFNKSVNFNDTEIIDNCVKSMDMIPTKYILENHPWIDDIKEAEKLLEKEKNKKLEEFNNNMMNFNNNDE